MTPTPDSIIEKIRKLQALADRAGTEAEAALAAQKVAELCEQHNLDIGVARIAQEETTATENQHVHASSRWAAHWSTLSAACGDMFTVGHYRKPVGVAVKNQHGDIVGRKEAQALVFYGLKANVISATVTYEYYLASVESLLEGYILRRAAVAAACPRCEASGWGVLREFIPRFARCSAQSRALLQSEESVALVRLENTLIKAHRAKVGLRAGHSTSGARSSDHYSAGYAAGGRVDIHGARTSRMLR